MSLTTEETYLTRKGVNWKVSYIQNEARYEVRGQRDGNKRLRGISDTMRRSNIPLVGVPEGN